MTLLTEALILGLFAMSLDLMVGYTRLVSFGHAAAYGFGAYVCGWLLLHTSLPMLATIPISALLAGVIAVGVAWVCTQATGVSFSMLTLAFAQLLYAVAYKWTAYKIAVVALSYALGALAGALYAPFAGFANTELLFWLLSGQVLIMVIVGGAGTLIGPMIGAAFFLTVEHQLSNYTEAWALFFGLIFIAFVIFAPEGIWGLIRARFRRRTAVESEYRRGVAGAR